MRISDWSSDVCSSDLTISAMHASRAGEALSANTRIPTVATPTAPMPVQIAYAVPTGIVRSAWVSSHRLTAAAAAVATLGHSRSEEHTSALQSLMRTSYAVFFLKKKRRTNYNAHVNK